MLYMCCRSRHLEERRVSDRSRKIHWPRITFLPSRFACVAWIILLKYRVPVYVSFFSIDLIRSLSHRCRPLQVNAMVGGLALSQLYTGRTPASTHTALHETAEKVR
jgi:hypothetical protein